jgi:polyphosphate kinase
MKEDGNYTIKDLNGEPPFNLHKELYDVTKEIIEGARLF